MERNADRTPDRMNADPASLRAAADETREPPEASRVRDEELARTRDMQTRAEAVDRSAERTVESNADALGRGGNESRRGAADAEKLADAARALKDDVRRTRDAVRAVDPDVGA
jgi:hypothetical protein